MTSRPPAVIAFSNVYDDHYHALRGEDIAHCLSSPKRRDLFHCLELATGRKVIVLSAPPKALNRRVGKWLSPVETIYSSHQQFFSANWDAPKARVPLSWLFYAWQALRRVRDGDLIVIDNYELIYVLAAWLLRLFRKVRFVLDYEDGKHVIDRSWSKVLSDTAEFFGRPLLGGALLANPALRLRLPPSLPQELVPGFFAGAVRELVALPAGDVRFIYSGTLDHARGVDVLLEALPLLPETGWHLEISGGGPLLDAVASAARHSRWKEKMTFHAALPTAEYVALLHSCHVGLNCQKASDPISAVTFPSKIFSYLSAGLLIISSKASGVEMICGTACSYYERDEPESLAGTMRHAIAHFSELRNSLDVTRVQSEYSIEGTASRLRRLFDHLS